MYIDDLLCELRDGLKIRKKNWVAGYYLQIIRLPPENEQGLYICLNGQTEDEYRFSVSDILSDRWELI